MEPIKCWRCSGTGLTLLDPHRDEETCPTCDGTGQTLDHPSKCRCRDCADARGDWQYHARKEERA